MLFVIISVFIFVIVFGTQMTQIFRIFADFSIVTVNVDLMDFRRYILKICENPKNLRHLRAII